MTIFSAMRYVIVKKTFHFFTIAIALSGLIALLFFVSFGPSTSRTLFSKHFVAQDTSSQTVEPQRKGLLSNFVAEDVSPQTVDQQRKELLSNFLAEDLSPQTVDPQRKGLRSNFVAEDVSPQRKGLLILGKGRSGTSFVSKMLGSGKRVRQQLSS